MENKKHFTFTIIFLVVLTVIFFLLSIYLSKSNENYRNLDFFTFWLGSRMSAQGQNVYDQTLWVANHALYGSTWVENLFYVYPLSTAIVFIPFGLLNIKLASTLWIFLTLVAIAVSVLLILSLWKKINWTAFILPVLLGSFLFRPTFLNLFVGQIDGFLFFFFALTLFLFSKKKTLWACAVIALMTLKPNIGIPLIALFVLHLLSQKKWKETAILLSTTIIIFLAPLLFDSHWIKNYFYVVLHKSADNNLFPNLHGLAGVLTNGSPVWTIFLWLALSLLLLGAMIWVYLKHRSKISHFVVALLALLISTLVTPYLRAYDLIFLLLPILYITGNYAEKSESFLKINLIYLSWSLAAFVLLFLAVSLNHDIFSIFLTILVLLSMIIQIQDHRYSLTILTS